MPRLDKPTKLTDAQLTKAARITKEDVARAVAQWKRVAPARFKQLLDAPELAK